MRIVKKVFYKELLWSIVSVLLGFLLLIVTIDAFAELNRLGRADYTVVTLVTIVLLKLPEYVYQLLPICSLIGAILALSNMAARSELVAWRVSGLNLQRLLRLFLLLGAALAALLWFLGDLGIARAERRAKEVADIALHRQNFFSDKAGYWSKQNLVTSGSRMINIRNLKEGGVLEDISLYELTPSFSLNRLVEAKTAMEQQGQPGTWVLHDVRAVDLMLDDQGLVRGSKESLMPELTVNLAENTLDVIRNSDVSNTNLTMAQLQERINTMKATGQSPRSYEVAFWQKFFYPFGVVVMLLLSLPFAFMQTRKGGVGIRVFIGIVLGLLFFTLTAMAKYLGELVNIYPIVLAFIPSAFFLLIAVIWIYKVTRI